MFRTTYLKKFLLSGSVYAATVITSGAGDGEGAGAAARLGAAGAAGAAGAGEGEGEGEGDTGFENDICDPRTGKLLRRSDLPLYDDTPPAPARICEESKPNSLEEGISAIRKELWVWHDKYEGYREKIVEVCVTSKEHTLELIEQLRKDELPVPRAGAVVISGLTGFVLGLRSGWFKRLFYGSACTGLMAAVCYPNEVAELTEDTLANTKRIVLIAYNFIYGVKPESLKLPSPSRFLGGPVESPEKEKGDLKLVSPAVSEHPPPQPDCPPKKPRTNDQSNPADKDLYSSRR